jgi:GDSL-like Lipase/Acylhydrolase family
MHVRAAVLKKRSAIIFRTVAVLAGLLIGCAITESVFWTLEYRDNAKRGMEGSGCGVSPDERWGWKLKRGDCLWHDPEFTVTFTNNQLFMNDEPYQPGADDDKTRILALGNSHTQAVGVSTWESWPKVLQRDLNQRYGEGRFRVYNAGTGGYSVHQYLLRLMDQGPQLRPQYVIVGFGFAADLYNMLPPSHGGWDFFPDLPRTYFDFDATGKLVEQHWTPAPEGVTTNAAPKRRDAAQEVREILDHFATFRYLRRSNLALAIGARVRLGGQSLWPNMEVLLQKNVSPNYQYNWDIVEAVLDRIDAESKRLGAQLVVLGIPYLPQVYDEVWQNTFGSNPEYSRDAGTTRLREWLESKKIAYVESTDELRAYVKKVGHWVHYHKDAHPTAEGHEVMARVLVESGLFTPRPAKP